MSEPLPIRVLVVGLGGIGSDSVQALRARAAPELPDRFTWHVIDTDANHPRDPAVGLTLLSLPGPPDEIAHARPEIRRWFPLGLSGHADRMAGHWRVAARLAFAEALHRPETLFRLEADVDRLCQQPPTSGEAGRPTVVLVGSLAGATGSGIALQTALYLRHAVADRLGIDPALVPVHGLFLLPDALVAKGMLPPQIAQLARARAYATVKEIAGIDAALAGALDLEVRLEHLPGQGAIPVAQRPFRSVHFVDHPSPLAGALSSAPEHLAFALQALLSGFIEEAAAGRPGDHGAPAAVGASWAPTAFGTIALARLEFPRAAVARYVAQRWVHENVDAAWLTLERAYEEQIEAYEHDVFADAVPEPPSHAAAFTSLLESEDDEGPRGALLRRVRRQVRTSATAGREGGGSRASAWLDALQRRLDEVGEAQPESWRCPAPDDLADRATVWPAIDRSERDLARWRLAIHDRTRATATALANEALAYDLDDGVLERGTDESRLPYWLFDEEGRLHPLAVRHLAYETQELLGTRLQRLRGDVDLLEHELDAYEHAYDDLATPERVETALDRLSGALSQPAITRLFRNDLAIFIAAYNARSQRHAATLRAYERAMRHFTTQQRVLRGVEALANAWEAVFWQLRLGSDRLRHASRAAERTHERSLDPFVRYVYADETAKRRLYDACRDQHARVDGREAEAATVRAVFHKLVHPWASDRPAEVLLGGLQAAFLRATCATALDDDPGSVEDAAAPDHPGPIPQDVLAALVREAGALGIDVDEHLRNRILDLARAVSAADPHDTPATAGLTLLAHPALATRLPQAAGEHRVVSVEAISRHVIVGFAASVAPSPALIAPFAPASDRGPAGDYRTAYEAERKQHLEHEPGFVPHLAAGLHLDPRWFQALPDLDEGANGTRP